MQTCIYGPSGSGKSTKQIHLMEKGFACFDSDFIYAMYHIHGGNKSNPNHEEVWTRVVDKFCELYERTQLKGYEFIFTADVRIRDFLKSKGLLMRNLSKQFSVEEGERDLEVPAQ
jgi:cytidylate kinase